MKYINILLNKNHLYLALYVGLSAVSPILKQLISYKILLGSDVPNYLYLSSLLFIMAPYLSMGWGDLFARSLALGANDMEFQFTLAQIFNILCCIIIISILKFIDELNFTNSVIYFFDLLLIGFLYNLIKIYRSQGKPELFFKILAIKASIDIIFYLNLFFLHIKVPYTTLFLQDILSSTAALIFVLKKLRISNYFRFSNCLKYFSQNHKYAFSMVGISFLFSFFYSFDRLFAKFFLDNIQYKIYMFVTINASLLYSTKALLVNFLYPIIAKKISDNKKLREYNLFYFLIMLALSIIIMPLQFAISDIVAIRYYPELTIKLSQIISFTLLGWLTLYNMSDLALNLKINLRAVSGIISFCFLIYFASLAILSHFNVLNISSAIIALFLARVFYFGMTNYINYYSSPVYASK